MKLGISTKNKINKSKYFSYNYMFGIGIQFVGGCIYLFEAKWHNGVC